MRLLNSRAALWLTIFLLVQGVVYYATAARPELTPPMLPLRDFAPSFGDWRMARDVPLEKDILDVLKADDVLQRVYLRIPDNAESLLFIGYFKTQRTGATPHSPKNCLPGSGWEPVETPGTISIPVPGRDAPLVANRYVVALGEEKSVVLYWYQSHNRIIASEFSAKFWLIADSIRYRRSDTALVKVVVPVRGGDTDSATKSAVGFIQAAYPAIAKQLPR